MIAFLLGGILLWVFLALWGRVLFDPAVLKFLGILAGVSVGLVAFGIGVWAIISVAHGPF